MRKIITFLLLMIWMFPWVIYAQEVVNSVPTITQAGNPKDPPPGVGIRPTAPSPPENIQAAIKQEFSITMLGFDQIQLEQAWSKFWELSNTNFKELAAGAVIASSGSSAFGGSYCRPTESAPNVFIRKESGAVFNHLLIHELAHYIHNCRDVSVNGYAAHEQALAKEGAVSYYAKNPGACVKDAAPVFREDYAEMIAYYLVPEFTGQLCVQAARPDLEKEYPMHFAVAKSIIEKN